MQEVLTEYDLIDYVSGLESKQRVEYAPGYLTNSNQGANQHVFFSPENYDPQIVPFVKETKHPISVGELLTLGSVLPVNAF